MFVGLGRKGGGGQQTANGLHRVPHGCGSRRARCNAGGWLGRVTQNLGNVGCDVYMCGLGRGQQAADKASWAACGKPGAPCVSRKLPFMCGYPGVGSAFAAELGTMQGEGEHMHSQGASFCVTYVCGSREGVSRGQWSRGAAHDVPWLTQGQLCSM